MRLFCVLGALLFASLIMLLLVAGCGGGGGGVSRGVGGSGSVPTAAGKVILPAGFKLPLSQLRVIADNGNANVKANGSFVVAVGSAGPRVVQLVDSISGKIALLGYVDAAAVGSPYAGGKGEISVKATADALLFMGLLGGAMPPSSWSDYLNDIRGSAQEGTVETSVASAVAANPGAITDGDQRIMNAVGAVQSTYTGPVVAKAFPSKPAIAVQRVTVTRRAPRLGTAKQADIGALIKVEPIAPQASLVIEPNPDGDGIIPVSTSRRRGAIFVYKVGSGPDAKDIKPIDPPQETFADVEVEPTLEIQNVATGILNGLRGKFAYLPLKNEPILLPPDPVEEIAVYDVVAIGPGESDTIPNVETAVAGKDTAADAAARAEYDKEWRAALLDAQLKVVFDDIVDPVLIEMVAGVLEEGLLPKDAALKGVMTTAAKAAPGFEAALEAGDLRGAASAVLKAIEHNLNGVRTQVMTNLAQAFVSTEKLDAASFQLALQNSAKAISIIGNIDKAITLVDVTQAFHDNRIYETADNWVADVLQPVVKLTPQKSFVDVSDPLAKLAVTIQNVSDLSHFKFQWSNTATEGKLESSNSTANLGTGIIPDSTAVYVTDFTKFQVGGTDTVTVKVFDENDLTTPIATVSATVTAAPPPCATKAPGPVTFGKFPAKITLSEPSTRPGDIFTVTVAYPADPGRDEDLEITLWSAPGDFTVDANTNEACQLLTVDGRPAKSDSKDVFFSVGGETPITYHVADTAIAQTHVLVFKMKEPTDLSGNPEAYCSNGIDSTNHVIPPYVIASGFGTGPNGTSYAFFNENP